VRRLADIGGRESALGIGPALLEIVILQKTRAAQGYPIKCCASSPIARSPVIRTRSARKSSSLCRPSKHSRHATRAGGTISVGIGVIEKDHESTRPAGPSTGDSGKEIQIDAKAAGSMRIQNTTLGMWHGTLRAVFETHLDTLAARRSNVSRLISTLRSREGVMCRHECRHGTQSACATLN